MTNASPNRWPEPWPIDELVSSLCEGNLLAELVKPKDPARKRDVRENLLEDLAKRVMCNRFDPKTVHARCALQAKLNLSPGIYPARCKPDIAVEYMDHVHICEIKSGRTDYNRFDCELDSGCREYLASIAHSGQPPWEVEQDILKLHRFREISTKVGSCVLILIDVPLVDARSWTNVFSSPADFRQTMRTELVRSWAEILLSRTRTIELSAAVAKVQLIVCEVVAWREWLPVCANPNPVQFVGHAEP